jgi:hypothetical protein
LGYTTDFGGKFKLDKPLSVAHLNYLKAFADMRHMKRRTRLLEMTADPKRLAVGLSLGVEGEFFVGSEARYGEDNTSDVINHNEPPATQPGLWCQWVPTEDGTGIEWDGSEKFYEYIKWLEYLIENFLKPWGYKVNGLVEWFGEERSDTGEITVKDNVVTSKAT